MASGRRDTGGLVSSREALECYDSNTDPGSQSAGALSILCLLSFSARSSVLGGLVFCTLPFFLFSPPLLFLELEVLGGDPTHAGCWVWSKVKVGIMQSSSRRGPWFLWRKQSLNTIFSFSSFEACLSFGAWCQEKQGRDVGTFTGL